MLRRFLSLAALALLSLEGANVPSGTELQVRLLTKLASDASKTGQPVEAVVIAPVIVGSEVAIAPGAKVRGQVTSARAAAKPQDQAVLELVFSAIVDPAGKPVPAKLRLTDVENAREQVDPSGRILGILASQTAAARLEQGIEKVAEKNPALADLLGAATGAVLDQKPSGEIRYEPGVELRLRLEAELKAFPTAKYEPPRPVRDAEELYRLVNSQPFQTMAETPRKPSDITNLMFIATEEQLHRAFKEAGWHGAHELNTGSVLETVRAIASVRGYKEAPMSRLLLEGKRSTFDFQKQNNTFAKRHHLRIWARPESFGDKPVWVSSSTHDIGIAFSQENATFIHVIDSEIDKERAKVVSDLLFTGRVESLSLVDRPEVPRKTRNATGDEVVTDGRMAIIVLR